MKLTFLGTGTSHGIPVIGCNCKVCRSHSKKNKRYRCSAFIETNNHKKILIDIGPEFRLQAVENKITGVDALLLTHSHADHLHGIDDLRIFSCDMFKKPDNPRALKQYYAPPIPIFSNNGTIDDVSVRFSYFFAHSKQGGGHAKVELKPVDSQFKFDDITITPIPMMHGSLNTTGWLLTEKQKDGTLHSIAYLTDCSYISDESLKLIKDNCYNLDHLIIDALRIKEHSTHFSFMQAMEFCNKLAPRKVWFIHVTHNTSHYQIKKYIKQNINKFPNLKKADSVQPAYDKLKIKN